MKKSVFTSILSGLLMAFLAVSCGRNDDSPMVNVTLQAKCSNPDVEPLLSKLHLEYKEQSGKTKTATFGNGGKISLTLAPGVYSFIASYKDEAISLVGSLENQSINDNSTLVINVESSSANKDKGLVFGEVFFNGERNNGQMMHPDQYFTVANNSDHIIYADGLCFSVTAHANWSPADEYTKCYDEKKEIPVFYIYRIPGSGKEHPIAPGKQIVIANTAINHNTDDKPNSIDLSGADFEAYFPNIGDVDNPNVPNLDIVFTFSPGFFLFPKGVVPGFMYRIKGDIETFKKEHIFETKNPKGEKEIIYSIPESWIIDGIETGNVGMIQVKSLPISVDKGFAGVQGCHMSQLAARKQEVKNGRTYWVDTNNSSEDVEMIPNNRSYPRK